MSVACLLLVANVSAKSPEEWRDRNIYQLLTDRFATDSASGCDDLRKYCGGTYKGMTAQLDYISELGFDAVC